MNLNDEAERKLRRASRSMSLGQRGLSKATMDNAKIAVAALEEARLTPEAISLDGGLAASELFNDTILNIRNPFHTRLLRSYLVRGLFCVRRTMSETVQERIWDIRSQILSTVQSILCEADDDVDSKARDPQKYEVGIQGLAEDLVQFIMPELTTEVIRRRMQAQSYSGIEETVGSLVHIVNTTLDWKMSLSQPVPGPRQSPSHCRSRTIQSALQVICLHLKDFVASSKQNAVTLVVLGLRLMSVEPLAHKARILLLRVRLDEESSSYFTRDHVYQLFKLVGNGGQAISEQNQNHHQEANQPVSRRDRKHLVKFDVCKEEKDEDGKDETEQQQQDRRLRRRRSDRGAEAESKRDHRSQQSMPSIAVPLLQAGEGGYSVDDMLGKKLIYLAHSDIYHENMELIVRNFPDSLWSVTMINMMMSACMVESSGAVSSSVSSLQFASSLLPFLDSISLLVESCHVKLIEFISTQHPTSVCAFIGRLAEVLKEEYFASLASLNGSVLRQTDILCFARIVQKSMSASLSNMSNIEPNDLVNCVQLFATVMNSSSTSLSPQKSLSSKHSTMRPSGKKADTAAPPNKGRNSFSQATLSRDLFAALRVVMSLVQTQSSDDEDKSIESSPWVHARNEIDRAFSSMNQPSTSMRQEFENLGLDSAKKRSEKIRPSRLLANTGSPIKEQNQHVDAPVVVSPEPVFEIAISETLAALEPDANAAVDIQDTKLEAVNAVHRVEPVKPVDIEDYMVELNNYLHLPSISVNCTMIRYSQVVISSNGINDSNSATASMTARNGLLSLGIGTKETFIGYEIEISTTEDSLSDKMKVMLRGRPENALQVSLAFTYRRYSEFLDLDQLLRSYGLDPPFALPPKMLWWKWMNRFDESNILERAIGLGQYLKGIMDDDILRRDGSVIDFLIRQPVLGNIPDVSACESLEPSSSRANSMIEAFFSSPQLSSKGSKTVKEWNIL